VLTITYIAPKLIDIEVPVMDHGPTLKLLKRESY